MPYNPLRNVPPGAPICTSGKRQYATEDEARSALRMIRRYRLVHGKSVDTRLPESDPEREYYYCPFCQHYHLASKGRKARRATHVNRERRHS